MLLHQQACIASLDCALLLVACQQLSNGDSVVSSNLDFRWAIKKEGSDGTRLPGRVVLMCHSFSLPDPNDTLTVYEGDTTDGRVVKIITGEGCFEDWIVTSNAALLVLRTDAFNFLAKFELSFKADGEDARCSFSNPLVFKQPSGLFSDGTSSLQEMWRSSVCSWIIQPMGNPERVTVYFNRLGIKSSGTLTIYDGFDTSPEGILYECSGCGQVAPPLLESFKGGFTIEIQSTSYPGSGQQDSWGFEVEYYSTRWPDGMDYG